MTKKIILGCLRVPPVEYHWVVACDISCSAEIPGEFRVSWKDSHQAYIHNKKTHFCNFFRIVS
jgi:hypothetical protein